MAQKHRFHQQKRFNRPSPSPGPVVPKEPPPVYVKKPPTVYGKAFIVMEDASKTTFEFKGGAWVPFGMTIAECKRECQVKQLSQKVNDMTRYEIRCPVPQKA